MLGVFIFGAIGANSCLFTYEALNGAPETLFYSELGLGLGGIGFIVMLYLLLMVKRKR
ncbi:hypothetical protein IAD21_02408 [Abditibacteriota bacterium]|nr:hypothetical protein IAD21_02408 [Abditibacteriota bacterium]